MEGAIGVVRTTIDMPSAKQVAEIRRAAGTADIPFEDISFLRVNTTISTIKRLKRAGYSSLIVQSPARLSKEWGFLQKILKAIFALEMKLFVARDGQLIEVEMEHLKTASGLPVLGVSVNKLNLLDEIKIESTENI